MWFALFSSRNTTLLPNYEINNIEEQSLGRERDSLKKLYLYVYEGVLHNLKTYLCRA